MYLRCAQCRALMKFEIPIAGAGPVSVPCSGCGRRYRLAVQRPHAGTDQECYRTAKAFCEAEQIDLASAYSVLEGIMTLEEARASRPGPEREPVAGALPSRTPRSAADVAASQGGPSVPRDAPAVEGEAAYDPGFRAAVKAGSISIQQAVERGNRRVLAFRLAQRHRLPLDLALRVADSQVSVRQALTLKLERESPEATRPGTSASHGVWKLMVYGVGAMILAGLVAHFQQWWVGSGDPGAGLARAAGMAPAVRSRLAQAAAPVPPAPPPPLTLPRTDVTGQVIEVAGPDPRSVLASFCASGRLSGHREPVGIIETVPQNASLRLGVFRNLDLPEGPMRAIRIREDRRTGRWIAGDGRAPVPTEAVPDGYARKP